MNTTKNRILIKSLKLFNNYGISNISLRDIADEAKISVGNLQYHFKKREDIVEALYFQIVEKIDGVVFLSTDNLLKSFLNISSEIMTIFYEYHFFLLDFVTITRANQIIADHYAKLSKRRESDFLKFVDILVEHCIFREAQLDNEYCHLYRRVEVFSNFWFSSILIHSDVLSQESIEEYSLVICQSIYPYLTEEAKGDYADIFK